MHTNMSNTRPSMMRSNYRKEAASPPYPAPSLPPSRSTFPTQPSSLRSPFLKKVSCFSLKIQSPLQRP